MSRTRKKPDSFGGANGGEMSSSIIYFRARPTREGEPASKMTFRWPGKDQALRVGRRNFSLGTTTAVNPVPGPPPPRASTYVQRAPPNHQAAPCLGPPGLPACESNTRKNKNSPMLVLVPRQRDPQSKVCLKSHVCQNMHLSFMCLAMWCGSQLSA